MTWISVKERMPEVGDRVLTISPSEYPPNSWTATHEYWITIWQGTRWIHERVDITHWMPLPDPPEVSE